MSSLRDKLNAISANTPAAKPDAASVFWATMPTPEPMPQPPVAAVDLAITEALEAPLPPVDSVPVPDIPASHEWLNSDLTTDVFIFR